MPSDGQSQPTAQDSTSPSDLSPIAAALQTLNQTLEDGCECITTHDLIETYSLLHIRIRALAGIDSKPFSTHAPTLIQCLRRDIYEGLTLFPAPRAPSIGIASWDVPTLEDYELQSSIDSSQLCQAALLVTGLLLSLPRSLSDSQRSALLEPVIDVCSERHLSVFNADKIRAHALLCLRAYKVLQHVSASQLKSLIKGFDISFDRGNGEEAKAHTFKTIRHILPYDPSRFLEPLSTLLPKVLVHLTSLPCRMEACSALCGFALAKLAVIQVLPQLVEKISGEVNGFLDHHGSRSRTGSQQEYMLPSILQLAHQSGDSVWALVTLASLIVLADSQLFSRPRSFRLIFDTMRHSSKHGISIVRSLHTEVWKCLVWAMSRIKDDTDTLARASRVLAQDLKPGIGSQIVGVLLQHQDETLVPEAISILKTLIDHPRDSMLHEGVMLLNRLISGVGTSDDYAVKDAAPFDYLSHELVDGTWLRLDMTELQERLSTGIAPFPIASIRSLTEPEIVANWQELSEFWALAVEKLQKAMTAEQLTMLTGIWQALLLSQAHLTQGQRHLTVSTTFATKLATLITRFLTPGEADPETRLTQLSLVKNWWRVLRNVFHNPTPSSPSSSQPASWLSIPAEIVLSGIMEKQGLCLKNPSVKVLWSEICSELVSAGAPTLLHVLHTRVTNPPSANNDEEAEELLTVTRQLWLILGSHYLQQSDDVCWTSFAAFLTLPFHCDAWILEHEDSDMWRRVFVGMLLNARNDGVDDDKAIESLQAQVGEDAYRRDLIFLRTFETCVAVSETPICRRSLAIVNSTLSRLYGSASCAEKNVALALKLMDALRNLWDLEEASELVSALTVVQDGIALWLEDRNGLAQGEERIEMVDAVYVSSLRALGRHLDSNAASNHEPELQTLVKLEKLITSAFNSPTPNIAAPQAFMELWRAHYFHRFSLAACPEWVVTCVKLVGDLFGDRSIGEDASLGTSSPSTVIPDSQKTPINLAATTTPSKVLHREYSRFADLADAVGFGFQVGPSEAKGKEKTPTRRQPQDCETPKASALPLPWSPNIQSTRPRPPKRHLTEADLPPVERNWVDEESLEDRRPLKRTKTIAGPSTFPPSSPPVGPTSSPLALAESRRKHGKPPGSKSPLPPSSDVEDDDYDTWEAAISHKDIQDIQQELGRDGDIEVEDEDEQQEDEQDEGDGDEVILSPTFSEFPLRSRRRERSQTAPELELDDSMSLSAHPIPKAEPLRRHYSSSAQLDALQQAYAMVVETDGVSQLPVEDLLKLKRLTSRIGETVDEQIYQQLEREDDNHAEGDRRGRRGGVRGRSKGTSMAPN